MEYNLKNREIKLDRKINELDKFVIDFCNILDEYVIVSGYVSILFGRSRATEDVDLLVQPMNEDKFTKIWKKLYDAGFECLNTTKIDEAFKMLEEHAIRFSRKNKPLPNMEFKIIKNDLERYSSENKLKVNLKTGSLFISPIEMQIAFKLGLGSEKDIEDAKHLYELFKESINKEEFRSLIEKLKVKEKFEMIK